MDADLRQPVHSVLMTADTIGGVWTYCMTLVRALGTHGISVFLATMGEPVSGDQRRQASALDNVTLFESTFRLEWMDEPWEDVRRAGDWLLELEQRLSPDLVHLNGYAHGALDWEHPAVVVGHSCVLSWWRAVKGGEAPESWDRYRREVRRGLAAASCVVAPSRAMAAELCRYYGPLREVAVVANAAAFGWAGEADWQSAAGCQPAARGGKAAGEFGPAFVGQTPSSAPDPLVRLFGHAETAGEADWQSAAGCQPAPHGSKAAGEFGVGQTPSSAPDPLVRLWGNAGKVREADCKSAAGYNPALHKERVVFAAGRLWDEAKNVAALDSIAGDLEWPVLLAGDGYSPRGARLLGRLSAAEMQEYYARASIYALPARYEPFGLSVLEAALSGCALVLGDIPSLRENWDGAAIFVRPDDHDALRFALRNLIADSEIRLEMAVRAQARALNFTPERMAEQYLELYRTCAQNCSTTR